MKKSMKKTLIFLALTLLAGLICLIWLGSRSDRLDETVAENISKTSGSPAFDVRVVVPRTGLPLGGILPDWLVKKHDLTLREFGFDHTSPGAQFGRVAPGHLELNADGWELFIESDSEGRVAQGTHLVFPLGLGGKRLRLDCRPTDPATGHLSTKTRPGSDALGGRFLVELATCKNAESGKTTSWPPAPLTVSGSFAGVPSGRR